MGKMSIEEMNTAIRNTIGDSATFSMLVNDVRRSIYDSINNGWYSFISPSKTDHVYHIEVSIVVTKEWDEETVIAAIRKAVLSLGYVINVAYKNPIRKKQHITARKKYSVRAVYTVAFCAGRYRPVIKLPENASEILYGLTTEAICNNITKLLYNDFCVRDNGSAFQNDKSTYRKGGYVSLNFNDRKRHPVIIVDRTLGDIKQYITKHMLPADSKFTVDVDGCLIRDRYYYDIKIKHE